MPTVPSTQHPDPRQSVPLYRIFDLQIFDHWYTTTSEYEKKDQYVHQGVAAYIFPTQVTNTTPLFLFWLEEAGDHFITAERSEMEAWLHAHRENNRVRYSGILGYVFKDSSSGGVPFYKLYNANRNNHLYTACEAERKHARESGYRDDGPIGWVYPGSCSEPPSVVQMDDVNLHPGASPT
ncbi:hypothetical protein FA15DRAFT_675352 [Coprinopsis marcescibilis]|uniref:DUF5648 domain-containing protein n=1 Tax=Coprinopsis marcescibilis TaxID=230819 RepID=A0A5C3KEY3_COPMA|nr:hypothetical protein FA15DRAFT_675352 [Coprinopsis marcescibilis]